jgi:hypothetical protein
MHLNLNATFPFDLEDKAAVMPQKSHKQSSGLSRFA